MRRTAPMLTQGRGSSRRDELTRSSTVMSSAGGRGLTSHPTSLMYEGALLLLLSMETQGMVTGQPVNGRFSSTTWLRLSYAQSVTAGNSTLIARIALHVFVAHCTLATATLAKMLLQQRTVVANCSELQEARFYRAVRSRSPHEPLETWVPC